MRTDQNNDEDVFDPFLSSSQMKIPIQQKYFEK